MSTSTNSDVPSEYFLYNLYPRMYAVMAPNFLAWVERVETPREALGVSASGAVRWGMPWQWAVIHEEKDLVCSTYFETVDEAAQYVLDFYRDVLPKKED